MNDLRGWLDRQARTRDQRIDISVALGCSWLLMMVCASLHYYLLDVLFLVVTATLMVVVLFFLARDHWENR